MPRAANGSYYGATRTGGWAATAALHLQDDACWRRDDHPVRNFAKARLLRKAAARLPFSTDSG